MPDGKPKENRGRAPTLYAIIGVKLLKGLVFIALAFLLYTHADNDLPKEFQSMLETLKLNPERKFWTDLALKVDDLTEVRMRHFALGTLIYSMFAVVEGVGLMFRIPWAGWLSIGESAFFIPIEVYELNRNFTWFVFVVLLLNVFMVAYLYRNRERLFRHHH